MPEIRQNPHPMTQTSTLPNQTGTWRAFRPVYVQLTSPCREACPTGGDTARWTDLLRAERFREAWEILTEDNPFPATLGRICAHPCEAACNRAQHDQPISINGLEQFLGDRALTEGWAFAQPAQTRPERVAVVGGGPAGLSCAYQLRRLGYRVTVIEARDRLGGNLTHAIPGFQLPAPVAEAEIARICDLGIEVQTGARVGVDLTWEELRQAYAAIFLATGAPFMPPPGIEGEELAGVVDGLQLLEQIKAGGAAVDGPVVVLGAGTTGVAAARALRRLGLAVTLVAPEPAGSLDAHVTPALEEGVALVAEAEVEAILGDGQATGVRLRDRELPARTVVLATGRMADLESLPEEAEVDERMNLALDPFTGATAMAGIFAGGDVAGARTAVEAVGAGKRAAAAIDAFLRGQAPEARLDQARLGHSPNLAMRAYARPESYPEQVAVNLKRVVAYGDIESLYFPQGERRDRRWTPPAERLALAEDRRGLTAEALAEDRRGLTAGALAEDRRGFTAAEALAEDRRGFTAAEALAEAQRCFNCGSCIGCENCLLFCPDMAVARRPDGPGFTIDWDHCKGCGVCVSECPREAMLLEEEVK